MLKQFNRFIQQNKLFRKKEKVLLAVSGGVDSVVMCELFYRAKIQFGIAHCNFQLRGKESDQDQHFVASLAKKYRINIHVKAFKTDRFAKKNKLSIQMAARELRYTWFDEVRKENGYDLIAVAHHKDDSIETFFINLIRGTGIAGLHGILPKQHHIVRPMLFATKKDIESFAKKNKLNYREDSSNRSDKYLRNKIRHHVIPVLKEINPRIDDVLSNDIERIREVEQIYLQDVETKKKALVTMEDDKIFFSIKKLKRLSPLKTYLFEFLRSYNFNMDVVERIIESLDGNSGTTFYSSSHRLVKDRESLIVTKKDRQEKAIRIKYTVRDKKGFKISSDNNLASIDYGLLKLPLRIRKWQHGDYFYPLGMSKKKKISDFLVDNKVSLIDKENVQVLLSGNNIVWVIGMRIDDRYKITERTKKIYVCEIAAN